MVTMQYFIFLLFLNTIHSTQYPLHNPFYEYLSLNKRQSLIPDFGTSNIQVRTLFQNCNQDDSYLENTNKASSTTDNIKCLKKLSANINLSNLGNGRAEDQYIIIDKIFNPNTGQQEFLMSPYLVFLQQEPMMQYFGMKYKKDINAEAKEEVINKQIRGFKGCDDFSKNPTCGYTFKDKKLVPFSQGFCCSCDEMINQMRQPGGNQDVADDKLDDSTEDDHHISGNNTELSNYGQRTKKLIKHNKLKTPNKALHQKAKSYKSHSRHFRSFRQIRGGQNCLDKRVPIYADPKIYHDSAHCLRYSDLFYSVYALSEPVLRHSVAVKIYQKRETEFGSYWIDLTSKQIAKTGTLNPDFIDSRNIFSVKYQYSDREMKFGLDAGKVNLLVPNERSKGYTNAYRNPEEYLVVKKRKMHLDGQCDSPGVGYAAFFNQKDRCGQVAGTCLKNQPLNMWRKDRAAELNEKKGKYFLKNFATVPMQPIVTAGNGEKVLSLIYDSPHRSGVRLTIRSEDNMVFSRKAKAKITEIYTDATSDSSTEVIVKVHNDGLTCKVLKTRITGCPLEVPSEWNMESEEISIPPQRQIHFRFLINGQVDVLDFCCSAEVLDSDNKIIAIRKLRIHKDDRCMCCWYCMCTCMKTGIQCKPMTKKQYAATGCKGGIPRDADIVMVSRKDALALGFFSFFILILIILFSLGLTKAIIGVCCCSCIGSLGLDILIGLPRRIYCYYEIDLKNREVEYDCEGYPIHPDTGQRSVRNINKTLEFCLNIAFFFTYPTKMTLLIVKDLCCPFYTYFDDNGDDQCFAKVDDIVMISGQKAAKVVDSVTDNDLYGDYEFRSSPSSS